MRCPHCNEGTLVLMDGSIPYDVDHYMCRSCHSTYSPWENRIIKLKKEELNEESQSYESN
jgi:transposase-like protein